jgi:hypothetical protein
MPVLLIAAFFVTAAATLAALGTRFDFTRPIEMQSTHNAIARLLRGEFPTVA